MDTATATVDADLGRSYGNLVDVEEEHFDDYPVASRKNTVIKFTRIPSHDVVNKASWSRTRVRSVVSVEDQQLQTTRSLQINVVPQALPSYTQRKIVTIAEDDENDLHPKFSKSWKQSLTARNNRAIQVEDEAKQTNSYPERTTTGDNKYPRMSRSNVKLNNALNRKDSNLIKTVPNKIINVNKSEDNYHKIMKKPREKVPVHPARSATPPNTRRLQPKSNKTPPSTDKIVLNNRLSQEQKQPKQKTQKIRERVDSHQRLECIRVPLQSSISQFKLNNTEKILKIHNSLNNKTTETENPSSKDAEVITDLSPKKIDQAVFTEDLHIYDTLNVPNVSLTKNKEELVSLISKSLPDIKVPNETPADGSIKKSASYIIGQATLTYTTKQKINFHVVNRTPDTFSYPMNVVSLFRNENKNTEKLNRPKDVIGAIRVNKEILPRGGLTDQFERELNFIDSFLESLHYLEGLEKGVKLSKESNDPDLNLDCSEYSEFLDRLEYNESDDADAVASKSLCLLNLLIHDEQRRAKNLLFVLKMREDALKDFTKSQILYLENKKKQYNTDIPTLKKKQRGALLKLQHECGEMQRMKKALLTLSEKRKAALMKTKKNIELKLSNVNVDKIVPTKKKPRKVPERAAPLKCFDLSSSEEKKETGDMVVSAVQGLAAAENFVVVDGAYLNILFQNLRLPQIFSSGRQYEVNEEALKNILNSANSQLDFSDSEVMAKFVDQLVLDKSSSPSTARSLVEELDQYYKVLSKDGDGRLESESHESVSFYAAEEETVGPLPVPVGAPGSVSQTTSAASSEYHSWKTGSSDASIDEGQASTQITSQQLDTVSKEDSDISIPDVFCSLPNLSTYPESSTSLDLSACLQTSAPSLENCETRNPVVELPSADEAERLRRQQLAIEREIKALEQQQLLIVREIPDKPPPPYTPPSDPRAPPLTKKFLPPEGAEGKIQRLLEGEKLGEKEEAFDLFLRDFCEEVKESEKALISDKPWDACNLLPKQEKPGKATLARQTLVELNELLAGVAGVAVSGLGGRRPDNNIDEILQAEWRRREPEWTTLHTDEAAVKNQLFQAIFDGLLNETVDDYKKIFNQ